MRQFHAHCVCVVGKTTVCRIFSCQISLVAGRWPTRRIRDVGLRGTLGIPLRPLFATPCSIGRVEILLAVARLAPTPRCAPSQARGAAPWGVTTSLLHRLLLHRLRRTHGHQLFGELGVSGPQRAATPNGRRFHKPSGGFRGPREAGAAQCRALKQSGEYRARTGDLLDANQALSQLS